MTENNIEYFPAASRTKPTDMTLVDTVATLISSWYVRKDQKFFDIDRPNTPLSKTDIERVSLNRLSALFNTNELSQEVLRLAFKKAIEERHTDQGRSIPVWSGDQICRPSNKDRMIWTNGFVTLNTWRWPTYRALAHEVEPSFGVAGEFFDWLIPRESERQLFLDWLSWCLQNEADKPTWAPFLYSKTKGSGKSTACQLASRLFGEENSITQNSVDKLVARFNLPLLHSKLVISEELKLRPESSQGNTLKTYITERTTVAEQKGREASRIQQSCCFLFTSNHLPLWIEQDDRRYYVIEIDHDGHASGPRSADFGLLVERLQSFLEDDHAVASLYRALLERKQGANFNAKSLNVETCSTAVMRRIHGASRQTTVDQLEELLNRVVQNAVPEGDVAQIVQETLKANVNSTKHLMTDLGWTKIKVKWGGIDYTRALWVRPGFSVEGGRIVGEDGSNQKLSEHLEALEDRLSGPLF